MKRNLSIVGTAIAMSMLLHGCMHDTPNTTKEENNNGVREEVLATDTAAGEDTLSQLPEGLADVRRPDMKVRIRKGSALLLETEGFQLSAVDTAVRHAGVYSVTSLLEEDLEPLPQGMKNMTAAAAGYRLLPGGEHFSPYAEVRVAYDPARLPEGYTADDIYTSYYDGATQTWVRLERLEVDTVNREIVSATTHFTDFINELLKSPEMPETQAFVPTQMSGLEAANPLAGYSTIAPPVANNMGTANLTYPIQVPAGRGGMQPNLALTYNSNGGNGLCGMGWDLQIPCISVETRWGVPLYDANFETETYLLNGEQLLTDHNAMPTFAKEYEPRDPNFVKRFYPRVEGAFDSILRYGNSPQTYWWEVYDRSGTRYIYGLGDGELRSQQQNAVAKWYLTRVIDRNDNTTRYQYKTYRSGADGAHSGTAIYLDKISYTAYHEGIEENPWYGYGVSFHYNLGRNDPVITGNYGVKENVCMRLAAVKTWYVKYGAAQNGKPLLGCTPPCLNELQRIPDPVKLNELWGIIESVNKAGYNTDRFASRFLNWDSYSQIDSSLIRGYRLLYTESETGKSLLSAVAEMSPEEWDSCGNINNISQLTSNPMIKYHKFQYKAPNGIAFGDAVDLSSDDESIMGIIRDILNSPLGGSNDKTIGGGIGVGVGLGKVVWLRTLNIEGSGFWSKTWNDGSVTLVDLNGDGYPDRLWKLTPFYSTWKYQLLDPYSNQYGETGYCSLPTNSFSHTVTKSKNYGGGVHAGFDDAGSGVNLGYQHTHSDATTDTYFADVNADGFVDIIDGSKVYYNVSSNNTIKFSTDFRRDDEPKPLCDSGYYSYYSLENSVSVDHSLINVGTKSTTLVSGYVDEWQESDEKMITRFADTINVNVLQPLYSDTIKHSIVKSWIAPYSGTIEVSGEAVLDGIFSSHRNEAGCDGVRLSIQRNGAVEDSAYLSNLDSIHSFEKTMNINRGDRLYFRVEARDDTKYDIVRWNPEIVYTEIPSTENDTEGRRRQKFSSKEDFLSWQDEQFFMPSAGAVRIIAPIIQKKEFSDPIEVGIFKTDSLGYITSTLLQHIFTPSTIDTIPFDSVFTLAEGDGLLFRAESSYDVDWTKLQWMPHVVSDTFYNSDIPAKTILDHGDSVASDTVYSIDVWPSPRYRTFFMHTMPRTHNVKNNSKVTLTGSALSQLQGRQAQLVERTDSNSIVLDTKTITNTVYSFNVSRPGCKNLELYIQGRMPDAGLDNLVARLSDNTHVGIFFDTVCKVAGGGVETAALGKIYRQWGQFIYNDTIVGNAIDESLLEEDAMYDTTALREFTSDPVRATGLDTNSVDPEEILAAISSNLPSAETDNVSVLTSLSTDNGNRIWSSSTGSMYISSDRLSLTGYQEAQWETEVIDTVSQTTPLPSDPFSGISPLAIEKESEQNGHNVYVSASFRIGRDVDDTIGVPVSFNYSFGEHCLTSDYMDFNGDGYPDAVFGNCVQYTNSRGGMTDFKRGHVPQGEESGIHRTKYKAYSLQAGASIPLYNKKGKGQASVSVDQRKADVSGNGNLAYSDDNIALTWMDINGDGLPDRISGDLVNLNLGYDYYLGEDISDNDLPQNRSINCAFSRGLSGNVFKRDNISFSAGLSHTYSNNNSTIQYADINGDGLVDKIKDEEVFFNKGWGFSTPHRLSGQTSSKSHSHNIDVNGNLTFGVPIWFFKTQITPSASLCYSSNSTDAMLMDMNADGLPDIVYSFFYKIMVRYNQLYDVDKLTDVHSFYGNHMKIEYEQAPYSPGARQRPTVMKKLTVSDSTGNSSDKRVFGFGYKNYMHSIEERTPYGFDSVIVTQYLDNRPYRITRQHYRTDHYKMRGRKASELVTDASGRPYVKNAWVHELKRIDNGAVVPLDGEHCDSTTWPALDSVITRYYDPTTRTVKIETAERYVHADNGRVVRYNKHNNIAVINTDDVFCTMTYTRKSKNQSALPADVKVKDAQGNLLRHRFAEYDYAGRLARLTLDGDSQLSVSEYGYDGYGNALWFRGPENATGQRVKFSYTYDPLVHMFPTITEDSAFGDRSRVEYDVRLGLPLRVYSIGGDSISYTYDGWGRPRTIRAYQERNTNRYPTIRYRYWDGNDSDAPQINQPRFRTFTGPSVQSGRVTPVSCEDYNGWPIWAQTLHRSKQDDSLAATTILFADGHGRVLQTKKTAVINGNPRKVVSGHVVYDDAGRPKKSYEPFVSNLEYCEYHTPSPGGVVTQTSYDILDRVVENRIQIDHDTNNDIVTRSAYGFYRMGTETCFLTTTTDPEGRQSKTITNARGLTTRNIDAEGGVTAFAYDAVGQLTSSIDPDLFQTTYTYDRLGRLSRRDHPDAGTTRYTYDPAGNMILETNPLGQIQYIYNYQRLTDKVYSELTQNNVHYEYGTTGRNCGRITNVTDGSGVQSFDYDAMGNVSKSVRMLSVPSAGYAYTFTHSYVYDSWGRMLRMTYPDGEQIQYGYNHAGDLIRMTGKKGGSSRVYINDIRYNEYGQRSAVKYGNGSHVEYQYDPLQRLHYLDSKDGRDLPMQQITYEFDKVGNITLLHNDAPANGSLGGSYMNYYKYDKLNRLIWADGTGRKCEFNMDMQYTQAGRLGFKHQKWSVGSNQKEQKMQYAYLPFELSSSRSYAMHAPRMIMDQNFGNRYVLQWDRAGNLNQISYVDRFGLFNSTRHLAWTEDNRLYTVADRRYYSYYAYDHTGQRTLKMTGDASTVDVNAWEQHTYGCLDHVTLYPSPYMVLTEQGYTKHYYAGTERVAARIGSGGLSYDATCVTGNGEVAKRSDKLFWEGLKTLNEHKAKPEDFTGMSLVDARGKEVDWLKKIDLDKLAMSWQLEAKIDPGKIHFIIDDNSYPAMPGNTRYENEPDVYFYHSDHLGGASWITDVNGKPVQHLQYLPFGEPYVNQHPAGYQERYTFTGKERDEETGYGYFGARYMDYSMMTSFISVDRYASKYPFISPYAYCAWNPIKLIDPTGDSITYSGTDEQQAILKGYMDEFMAKCPQQYKLLNESKNVYNVQFTPENDDGSGGSFTYVSDGHFNVNIKENRAGISSNRYTDIEVLAHELKHAEQYENRQLGFLVIHSSGFVSGYAYDLYDEYEAAEQALLFSPEGISYKAVKDARSFTLSKYGGHLHHKKIDVFMQNLIDLEKSEIKPTIDERNARDRSKTIVYNKRK